VLYFLRVRIFLCSSTLFIWCGSSSQDNFEGTLQVLLLPRSDYYQYITYYTERLLPVYYLLADPAHTERHNTVTTTISYGISCEFGESANFRLLHFEVRTNRVRHAL